MMEYTGASAKNMNHTKEQISEKILNHALEIIYLLTGEKYVIVKKKSPHCCIHARSGQVPVKCDDVAVYFSMEEWDYVKEHKQQYQDVIMDTDALSNTIEITQHLDLDVPDPCSEDLNCVSINENGEYETIKDHRRLADSDLETSGGFAVAPGKWDFAGEHRSADPLLQGAIKVEIPDEIPDDDILGGLGSTSSRSNKGGNPLYRWDQNIWSISERILCGGGNRTLDGPAANPTGADPFSRQFPFHALNAQPLEKPFECIACGQLFKYKSSATRHYRVTHEVKPHQCNECGRRFATKFKFVVHKCHPSKNSRECWEEK